jgi:hypothetical protein
MRKGVVLLVTIVLASGTAAVDDCSAGGDELRTAYQMVVFDWERMRDYEEMMRGIGEVIQLASRLAGACLSPEKVEALDLARNCPSANHSPAILPLDQLSSGAEVLKATTVTREADGQVTVNGQTADLPNFPQFPGLIEERLSCFADCESDFITLYQRLETLLVDLGTAPSRAIADLLLSVLQLGTLVADCSAYIF